MKLVLGILCGLSSVLFAHRAWATLGEPIASVQNDIGALKASQKTAVTSKVTTDTSSDPYTVSEMAADGNTIRQYSNPQGIVFAVSWTGISKPDLTVLFGTYFKEYSDASEAIPKQVGTRSLAVKTSKMVVRRSGHMRDQHGLAYVPSLVPTGVLVENLP